MNQQMSLYKRLHTIENLEASWQSVKRNKGAGGIDRQTISQTQGKWNIIRQKLHNQLKYHAYKPKPVRRIYIPKSNKKKRAIGIPTVCDRIVQQATRSIIEPIIDSTFEDFSYGFRPEKSAKQALERVDEILNNKQRWVVQIDISQFFDAIPHEIILQKLQNHIQDKDIIKLIEDFLNAGVLEEGQKRQSTTGTPQGGVISPLLANLVLDAVDKHVVSHGNETMVRYADDFVIMAKTRRRAVHVYKEIVQLLEKLGLKVNQEKSRIAHVAESFTFLGYEFGGGGYSKGDGGTTITELWKRPAKKAIKALKEKIKYLTRRQQPRNIAMLTKRLNPVIRGWANYFNLGKNKSRFQNLDGWYRMRLRAFIHKRKNYLDNQKYPTDYFKNMGYLFLSDMLLMPAKKKAEQLAMCV